MVDVELRDADFQAEPRDLRDEPTDLSGIEAVLRSQVRLHSERMDRNIARLHALDQT